VTYGKSVPTANTDPEVVRIHRVMEHFQVVMRPGAYLVDRVPLLRYWPGYGKQLAEWHHEELELYRHQLRRVESEVVSGSLFLQTHIIYIYMLTGSKRSWPLFHQDTVGERGRTPTLYRRDVLSRRITLWGGI
jgi:hypothetical protein